MFIQSLNDNQVCYLVVGRYAVALYGSPRFTSDIDIWIDSTTVNAARIIESLEQFGFISIGPKEKDFLEADTIIQMGYAPHRIDLLTTLTGVVFDQFFVTNNVEEMDNVPISFINLENPKKE